jgi:prepilin-type N-terminal cleavage/methylation domain-containing protein
MVCSLSNRINNNNQRTGFTLVEILVVVSALAMLLAILLPALRQARILSKRTACQSNLKQIAIAWLLYLNENDGYFYQGTNSNLNYGGWRGIKDWYPRPLNKHLKLPEDLETEDNAEVFRCPADRGGFPGSLVYEKVFRAVGTSYQTNRMLIGPNPIGVPKRGLFKTLHERINLRLYGINRSHVCNPSLLMLIGDYGWINQIRPALHPSPELKKLAEWHGKEDCHNLAFLDTHVQFLNLRKGFYVTEEYCIVPFKDLHWLAIDAQEEL